MNIHFLNWNKEDFLHYKFLYRYVSYQKLIDMVRGNLLTMVSPIKWLDPFESRMMVREYQISGVSVPYKYLTSLRAICFSLPYNCEAQWKAYDSSDLIQVSFDGVELLKQIQTAGCENITDIYIGKVKYLKTADIDKEAKLILDSSVSGICTDDWLRLMLLKRISYEYEREVRFFIVLNDNESEKVEKVQKVELPHFDLKVADISKIIDRVTLRPIQKNNIEDDIRQFGINKVSHSALYHNAGKYRKLKV